ncbi:Rap1a/Tai family immunity protein [Rhizobium ruizarguesonis]
MKKLAFLAFCLASPDGSFAMSGAELIQSNNQFAAGYVLGVTEYRIGVVFKEDTARARIHQCVMESKVNSDTLLTVVKEYLNRHPEHLSLPAFGVVMNALAEMCPQ